MIIGIERRAVRACATTTIVSPCLMTLKICALVDDPSSTITDIRIRRPLGALAASEGIELTCLPFHQFTQTQAKAHDLFVIQRGGVKEALNASRLIRLHGKPLIYEIDDLLTEIPDFMPHQAHYTRWRPDMIDMIAHATLVSVSTPVLAEEMRVHNPRVRITPNYGTTGQPVDLAEMGLAPNHRGTNLIIASSDLLLLDFLIPAIEAIWERHQNQLRLITIGPAGPRLQQAGLPVHALGILAPNRFYGMLSALDDVIGIMPLDDSRFSASKSAVKFFDYALAGVACICSNVSPYRDVIRHGEHALLVGNTSAQWEAALQRLLEHPKERQTLARQGATLARQDFSLDSTARAWKALMEEALQTTLRLPWQQPDLLSHFVRYHFLHRPLHVVKTANRQRLDRRRQRRHRGTL